ncbi:Xylose isomerase domain protein TIM barrel [Caldicellulosiruptor saccharolyticus DSM 8903]|uniref:Xylose isomerase domain protein TIM barrel n=1 Tax=Caldicellulosiruptor saccharolyticus (strain ATCC 43494 / DSM 8903 / Tp8T 6331) TaxID=351627 RepID=A4XGK0_CALS8|nr:sugar phosphate isomerase/epimerase [Caldicellulosiruptor saccharolyticus]ABP66035.1 Xylose isomerase domain protein TIM barrel [Caldicellulosiruptor saccharolyticus DSM 8903]
MKYSFNTWCYSSFPTWVPAYPLEEVIKRLSRIGYDGIEIGCAAPHAWPYYLSEEKRMKIKKILEANNIKVSSMLPAPGGGPGANPASPIEEERKWTVQHYKDVIDLASEWGAPTIIYVAGWVIYGTSRKDAWKYSLESLIEIAEYAKSKNITVCVEPTSADSNLVETADDALLMMEQTGLPNVKVMFDTFHVLYRNEVPSDYIYKMGKNLKHIHISDHNRLAPGQGGMDFLPVLQALKDVGYDGYVTMEVGFNSRSVHPDSIARYSLEYLKNLEKQLK